MTVREELETIAKDCEECAAEADTLRSEGEKRAWQSVAYRIRHAAKRVKD